MMFIRLRHSLFIVRPFYLGGGHLFERDIFTMPVIHLNTGSSISWWR